MAIGAQRARSFRSGVKPEGGSVKQFVTVEPQVRCQAGLIWSSTF